MSKKGIEFDLTVLAEDSELEENLTAMPTCYTRKVHMCRRSYRFYIPKEIVIQEKLEHGDKVYFVDIDNTLYVYFGQEPVEFQRKFYCTRTICKNHDQLFCVLPLICRRNLSEDCKMIQLVQTRNARIWILREIIPHECISKTTSESIWD